MSLFTALGATAGAAAALTTGTLALGGGIISGGIQAGATTSAANAQNAAAQQALQTQLAARQQTIAQAEQYAAISPDEINSIQTILTQQGTNLANNMASIQRQQQQLDAVSPNVKASGQDLYNLLTGQSAAILAPLQTSLNNQRQQLTSQLAAQMGPGFATSSAGIQALTAFDQQSALTLQSAQQNAISTVGQQYYGLSNLQQSGQSNITGQTIASGSQFQQANQDVLSAYQNVQGRQTQAALGGSAYNQLNPFATVGPAGVAAGAPQAGQAGIIQGATNTVAGLGGYLTGQINNNPSNSNPLSSQIANTPSIQMPNFGSLIANNGQNPYSNIGAGGGYNAGNNANVSIQ